MNSLNLLSARAFGPSTSTTRPRSRSQGEALTSKQSEEILRGRSYSDYNIAKLNKEKEDEDKAPSSEQAGDVYDSAQDSTDEKAPLLEKDQQSESKIYRSRLRSLVKRIADALTALLTTIGAPVIYIVRSFHDENGKFSALMPFKRTRRKAGRVGSSTATTVGLSSAPEDEKAEMEKSARRTSQDANLKHSYSTDSLRSTTSESEPDHRRSKQSSGSTRSIRHKSDTTEEPRRQSIRIKLNNEEALKKRKQKRSALSESTTQKTLNPLTMDNIKSPTSPSSSLKVTRYPHAPQPPRPLIPRRQPSYSNLVAHPHTHAHSHRHPSSPQQQKTLVIDLDETLIHSLAKGNRMSSGHMVEVKLNTPVALSPPQTGSAPPTIIGPQHPILYYVHKRPHCEEFLRKVCKWYKLVVFTASVQEYADPVIDWLEQERKFFSGRFYRQHCTFRNGAYIKDLSSIEPDLSKVVILDNSPVSYIFHEDNAIPIEGWINDPTDNDLLHLIPMLEALQYVTDVRALLALRRGEADVS